MDADWQCSQQRQSDNCKGVKENVSPFINKGLAIACLLSASEGWRDAAERLGGAFAEGPGKSGLTDGKDK